MPIMYQNPPLIGGLQIHQQYKIEHTAQVSPLEQCSRSPKQDRAEWGVYALKFLQKRILSFRHRISYLHMRSNEKK